ncbi:hypothetical protein MACJ_000447 [Theileria orientalis]|uniref:Uncharacterized protein n=1 Tax=Theileria orientalis TaxID=68886 RepID=A0A976QRP5_THEOR|nr:hypothetical protein MACJ_000447 [Theileria orientalis]
MPLVFKKLGYTLAPGERFSGEDEAVDEGLEKFAKSEINRKEDIIRKLREMESETGKGKKEDDGKSERSAEQTLKNFLDSLTIVGEMCCDENVDQKKLEFHLKELATSFVKQGLNKLSDLMVTFNRPDDFYAEMIKSDEHMTRIIKALEARNNELTKKAVATIGKRTKKSIGKLSKKQYQLQQKNKFIKSVNVLKKKHKGGDIDKHLDKLISDGGSGKRRGRPRGSKNKATSDRPGGSKKKPGMKAGRNNGVSKIPKISKKTNKGSAKNKKGPPRLGRKGKSEAGGRGKVIKKAKRGRPRKSDLDKKGHKRRKT